MTNNDNIEVYKQKIAISCENMFSVAKNALNRHAKLNKVVIMEHAPRHDLPDVDPTGLKPLLANFANSTLAQLWHSFGVKTKIVIGKHNLFCSENSLAAWFEDNRTGRYDGVHMYGTEGHYAITASVLQITKDALSSSTGRLPSDVPRAQPFNQNRQRNNKMAPVHPSRRTMYTVPVSNQFDVLGN